MGNVTLSLSDDHEEMLRQQAEQENRKLTGHVEYLLEQYDAQTPDLATQ
jgi:hypothetical protein